MAKVSMLDQKKSELDGFPEIVLQNLADKLDIEAMLSADSIIDNDGIVVPISPSIDVGLSGGIPEGTWVVLTGEPKTGKTTLALHIMAQFQKPEYGGRNGYYLNIEGRLKAMNLNSTLGLDRKKFLAITSHKEQIYDAEHYLDAALSIMKDDPGSVIIIDSLSALSPSKEQMVNMGDENQMAMMPKMLSKFTRKANQILPVNKNVIIGITHIMGNPGFGAAKREKGGYAIAYQADIKLQATHIEKKTIGEKVFGQICHWKVLCSALGAPFGSIPMHIRYGSGVDILAELVELGVTYGFIVVKGSWYSYTPDGGEEIKVQGKEKFAAYLEENSLIADEIYKKIRNLVL